VATAFVALLLVGVAGLAISNVAIKRERDAKTTALARATTESARTKTVSNLLQEIYRRCWSRSARWRCSWAFISATGRLSVHREWY
jgi:hypothetical protein